MKRPIKDVIHNVRQKINGVYAKSDQKAIQKLVAIANENPSSRAGKKAIEKLHTIYGSDRTGDNLKDMLNKYHTILLCNFIAK